MTGTTTWKQNTITDERALARFFDSQVIFQVQTKLHIHRSWQIPAKTSEPMEQTQVNELSITSWNPDTLNRGKIERFLTDFDAIRRFMEIKTCLDSKKINGAAISECEPYVFFPRPSGNSWNLRE